MIFHLSSTVKVCVYGQKHLVLAKWELIASYYILRVISELRQGHKCDKFCVFNRYFTFHSNTYNNMKYLDRPRKRNIMCCICVPFEVSFYDCECDFILIIFEIT